MSQVTAVKLDNGHSVSDSQLNQHRAMLIAAEHISTRSKYSSMTHHQISHQGIAHQLVISYQELGFHLSAEVHGDKLGDKIELLGEKPALQP